MAEPYLVYSTVPGIKTRRLCYKVHVHTNIDRALKQLRKIDEGSVPNSVQVEMWPTLPITDGYVIARAGFEWVIRGGEPIMVKYPKF